MRKGSHSDTETKMCVATKTAFISREKFKSVGSYWWFITTVRWDGKDNIISVIGRWVPPILKSNHTIYMTSSCEWSKECDKAKDICFVAQTFWLQWYKHTMWSFCLWIVVLPLIVHSIVYKLVKYVFFFPPHNYSLEVMFRSLASYLNVLNNWSACSVIEQAMLPCWSWFVRRDVTRGESLFSFFFNQAS